MKFRNTILSVALVTFLVASSGCESHVLVFRSHKNVPPGQAKKASGSKSAKPFAPGQKKKH